MMVNLMVHDEADGGDLRVSTRRRLWVARGGKSLIGWSRLVKAFQC